MSRRGRAMRRRIRWHHRQSVRQTRTGEARAARCGQTAAPRLGERVSRIVIAVSCPKAAVLPDPSRLAMDQPCLPLEVRQPQAQLPVLLPYVGGLRICAESLDMSGIRQTIFDLPITNSYPREAVLRTHLETMTAKIKELPDLAQKTATDGISPIKNGMSKAVNRPDRLVEGQPQQGFNGDRHGF
jgi:hypothetical protein